MEKIATVSINGENIDIEVENAKTATAAEINTAMLKAGIDVNFVHAVTPARELLDKLNRIEKLERALKKENRKSEKWKSWFRDLRDKSERVIGHVGNFAFSSTWEDIGESFPWPSYREEIEEQYADD